ncbi:MAG: sialidase family protein [Planctomycetota bacterium]
MRILVDVTLVVFVFQLIGFVNEKETSFSEQVAASSENAPAIWQPRGIGGGGALYAPSFSPFDEDEIFLSSDMGELFHSMNSGDRWDMVRFSEIVATPGSQVQFTDDPALLYTIRTNGWQTVPVKSLDCGKTWKELAGDPTSGEACYLFADPEDAERVLLSSYNDLFFSNNGGSDFSLIYSLSSLYIGGVFWDGSNIFVGCRGGLLVSTDGGASFAPASAGGDLPGSYGMLSLTGAKQGGTTRLFCVARDKGDMWPDMQGSEYWGDQEVYRLDWGSASGWQSANQGIAPDDFPFFISMARGNVDVVYVAGATASPVFPMVYRSTDGGDHWQNTFLVNGNQNIATGWQCAGGDRNWWWGECALGFSVAATDPDRALITDFGFAHFTSDGGASWHQVYLSRADENPPGDTDNEGQYYHSSGLEPTSCWWITWINAENLFASFSDITGIRSRDRGKSWAFDYTGNDYNTTYHTVFDPSTGTLYGATSSVHDIYQSTRLRDNPLDSGSGEVIFSTDQGAAWQTLHDFDHPVLWLALDPADHNRMYASVVHSTEGDLYVTNSLQSGPSSSWTRLSSPPRTEGHPYNIHLLDDGTLVCTYSGRINSSGAFTLSSGVFVSTDGGSSWQDRTHPDMQRWTKDLVIDVHDPAQNTWYAGVFSHWGAYPNEVGGLYRTTDRGMSWSVIHDLYRVESCTLHPEILDTMYVTTETEGLWSTTDLNDPDPDFQQVKGYPFMHPMRVFFDPFKTSDVWVTSFGNGMRVRTGPVSEARPETGYIMTPVEE